MSFTSIFRALIMTPLSTGRTPQRTANGLVNVHRSRWAAHIPVLPDEYVELGIDKNMDGNGFETQHFQRHGGRLRFWMNVESVITDDTCFFWFGNRTDKDRLVGLGARIPGGYGIYMLPYGPLAPDAEASAFYGGNENEVYTDRLTCSSGRPGDAHRAPWPDAGQNAAFASYG